MTRSNARRASLGGLVAVALGALALLALPGMATAKDRNHDRIPDRWEKRHHLSLREHQARHDQDRDHLRNLAEFRAGDNPRDADTDNDGVEDGDENAGTIAAFDAATGKLTINPFNGDSVTGVVDEGTEIECEDNHAEGVDDSGARASHDNNEAGDDSDRRGESGDDSDNSGPGSTNSGHGDDNNEDDANCTTANLTVGAVVEEAELEIEHGAATFEEVELAG
jgi:hypothetical protein